MLNLLYADEFYRILFFIIVVCRQWMQFCIVVSPTKPIQLQTAALFSLEHKVQSTYVCRVQSSVWRLPKYWPPPSPNFHPASVSSPRTLGGGGGIHTRRAVRGVGGSIFWKTPDIGLASYSIISLRFRTRELVILNPWFRMCKVTNYAFS